MAFCHFQLAFPAHDEDILALFVECQLVQVWHYPGNEAVDLNAMIIIFVRLYVLLVPNFAHDFHTPFQEHWRVQSFAVVDGFRAARDLAQHLVHWADLRGIATYDAVVCDVARTERGGGWRRLDNCILNVVVVFLHDSFEMPAIGRLGWQQVWVQLNEVD